MRVVLELLRASLRKAVKFLTRRTFVAREREGDTDAVVVVARTPYNILRIASPLLAVRGACQDYCCESYDIATISTLAEGPKVTGTKPQF